MDAQVAQTAPLQATTDFCTFAVHEIRALGATQDGFGGDRPWYEALIRPRGMHRHWSPGDFIDRLYLERPVLHTDLEVLQRVASWLLDQETPTRVSINTHPESLTSRLFVDTALRYQGLAKRAGHSICIELIEFGRCRDKSRLVANAQQLRRAGVLIALDDFGSRSTASTCAPPGSSICSRSISTSSPGVAADRNHQAIVESINMLGVRAGCSASSPKGWKRRRQAEALRALEIDLRPGFPLSETPTAGDLRWVMHLHKDNRGRTSAG